MPNIALSQDYLRPSLHRHDTIFFSKMSHAADNTTCSPCEGRAGWDTVGTGYTTCSLEPLAATATTQSNHNSRNQWPPRPWLHGARFAAKIFLQITKYLLKWNEIWNVDSQGHALKIYESFKSRYPSLVPRSHFKHRPDNNLYRGAVGRKLTKVFETFSHKILGRWMDSQPILNIKISIHRKHFFKSIHCVPFLQNSRKHPNNRIWNVGLSLGPWFRY